MKQLLFIGLVLVVLLVAGCMNFSSSNGGTLKVYLTDAVLPLSYVQRIDVTISKIWLMSDAASLVVTDQVTTVNLLDLVGSEISFPTIQISGTYNQLRLDIARATITVNNQEHELRVSSGSLKYPFTEPLQINSDTVLVLDFDLSKSIKVTGSLNGNGNGPTEYHMTPVVHLRYGKLYDITGKVTSASSGVAHALVALTDPSTVVATTFTHKKSNNWDEGKFKLSKIKPGEYELKIFLKEKFECWDSENIDQYILSQTPDATVDVNLGYEDLDLGEIEIRSE